FLLFFRRNLARLFTRRHLRRTDARLTRQREIDHEAQLAGAEELLPSRRRRALEGHASVLAAAAPFDRPFFIGLRAGKSGALDRQERLALDQLLQLVEPAVSGEESRIVE